MKSHLMKFRPQFVPMMIGALAVTIYLILANLTVSVYSIMFVSFLIGAVFGEYVQKRWPA